MGHRTGVPAMGTHPCHGDTSMAQGPIRAIGSPPCNGDPPVPRGPPLHHGHPLVPWGPPHTTVPICGAPSLSATGTLGPPQREGEPPPRVRGLHVLCVPPPRLTSVSPEAARCPRAPGWGGSPICCPGGAGGAAAAAGSGWGSARGSQTALQGHGGGRHPLGGVPAPPPDSWGHQQLGHPPAVPEHEGVTLGVPPPRVSSPPHGCPQQGSALP